MPAQLFAELVFWLRRAGAVLLATSVLVSAAAAQSSQVVNVLPNSGVTIQVTNTYNGLPSRGYVPLRVTINNSSATDGKWAVDTRAMTNMGGLNGSLSTRVNCAVPAHQIHVFEVLAPLPNEQDDGRYGMSTRLEVRVSGPGVSDDNPPAIFTSNLVQPTPSSISPTAGSGSITINGGMIPLGSSGQLALSDGRVIAGGGAFIFSDGVILQGGAHSQLPPGVEVRGSSGPGAVMGTFHLPGSNNKSGTRPLDGGTIYPGRTGQLFLSNGTAITTGGTIIFDTGEMITGASIQQLPPGVFVIGTIGGAVTVGGMPPFNSSPGGATATGGRGSVGPSIITNANGTLGAYSGNATVTQQGNSTTAPAPTVTPPTPNPTPAASSTPSAPSTVPNTVPPAGTGSAPSAFSQPRSDSWGEAGLRAIRSIIPDQNPALSIITLSNGTTYRMDQPVQVPQGVSIINVSGGNFTPGAASTGSISFPPTDTKSTHIQDNYGNTIHTTVESYTGGVKKVIAVTTTPYGASQTTVMVTDATGRTLAGDANQIVGIWSGGSATASAITSNSTPVSLNFTLKPLSTITISPDGKSAIQYISVPGPANTVEQTEFDSNPISFHTRQFLIIDANGNSRRRFDGAIDDPSPAGTLIATVPAPATSIISNADGSTTQIIVASLLDGTTFISNSTSHPDDTYVFDTKVTDSTGQAIRETHEVGSPSDSRAESGGNGPRANPTTGFAPTDPYAELIPPPSSPPSGMSVGTGSLQATQSAQPGPGDTIRITSVPYASGAVARTIAITHLDGTITTITETPTPNGISTETALTDANGQHRSTSHESSASFQQTPSLVVLSNGTSYPLNQKGVIYPVSQKPPIPPGVSVVDITGGGFSPGSSSTNPAGSTPTDMKVTDTKDSGGNSIHTTVQSYADGFKKTIVVTTMPDGASQTTVLVTDPQDNIFAGSAEAIIESSGRPGTPPVADPATSPASVITLVAPKPLSTIAMSPGGRSAIQYIGVPGPSNTVIQTDLDFYTDSIGRNLMSSMGFTLSDASGNSTRRDGGGGLGLSPASLRLATVAMPATTIIENPDGSTTQIIVAPLQDGTTLLSRTTARADGKYDLDERVVDSTGQTYRGIRGTRTTDAAFSQSGIFHSSGGFAPIAGLGELYAELIPTSSWSPSSLTMSSGTPQNETAGPGDTVRISFPIEWSGQTPPRVKITAISHLDGTTTTITETSTVSGINKKIETTDAQGRQMANSLAWTGGDGGTAVGYPQLADLVPANGTSKDAALDASIKKLATVTALQELQSSGIDPLTGLPAAGSVNIAVGSTQNKSINLPASSLPSGASKSNIALALNMGSSVPNVMGQVAPFAPSSSPPPHSGAGSGPPTVGPPGSPPVTPPLAPTPPGFRGGRRGARGGPRPTFRNPGSPIFTGLSLTLGRDHGDAIKNYFNNICYRPLQQSSLDPDVLSTDWRAYLGFDLIIFTSADWLASPPGARTALIQWVASGGDLRLIADQDGGLDLPPRLNGHYGAGSILLFANEELANFDYTIEHTDTAERSLFSLAYKLPSASLLSPNTDASRREMETRRIPLDQATLGNLIGVSALQSANGLSNVEERLIRIFTDKGIDFSNGAKLAFDGTSIYVTNTPPNLDQVILVINSSKSAGKAATSSPPETPPPNYIDSVPIMQNHNTAVAVIVMIFGFLVGPLNLLVFCRGSRRPHLLWLIPLVSVVTSAIIILFIFLADGIGGQGIYYRVTQVEPDGKFAVESEVETSVTGFLTHGDFDLAEPAWLLAYDNANGGSWNRGEFSEGETHYSGDWLGSRRTQTLQAQAVVPTRASLHVVVSATGAAPQLHSEFDGWLENVFYRDTSGNFWKASRIADGQSVPLETVTADEFFSAWDQNVHCAPALLQSTLRKLTPQAGTFFALGKGDNQELEPVITGLRWTAFRHVVTGPVEY